MSAEKAVMAMLLANTALAALVDDDSIEPGILSQGAAYPALVVSEVSTVASPTPAIVVPSGEAVQSRVQVTVFAETYPQVKSILDGVRAACGNKRGTFNQVVVRNCRAELVGPDLKTPDDQAFMQSLDLIVFWIRA